jgi:hypothetical protein
MKYAFYTILILAIASAIFNAIRLDFNALLEGDSQIAVISLVASLCVAVLMGIMLMSMKINEKQNS